MTGQVDLSGLRDIIEPIQPDIFPLAVGWWIVLIGVVVGICLCILVWMRYYYSPLAYALRDWCHICRRCKNERSLEKYAAQLIRRAAVYRFGADAIAALSDTEWICFLENQAQKKISLNHLKQIAFSVYLPDNKKQQHMTLSEIDTVTRQLLKIILTSKKEQKK